MANTTYKTGQGDRWDTIAYKAYGDPHLITPIVEANPTVAITDVLPAGITIKIPVRERPSIDTALLPPWKR